MAITLHRGTWNSFPSHLIAQPNGDKNGIDNSSRNFVTPMGLKRMSGVWKLLWTFFLKLHGLAVFLVAATVAPSTNPHRASAAQITGTGRRSQTPSICDATLALRSRSPPRSMERPMSALVRIRLRQLRQVRNVQILFSNSGSGCQALQRSSLPGLLSVRDVARIDADHRVGQAP